jgi:hypothetical protein
MGRLLRVQIAGRGPGPLRLELGRPKGVIVRTLPITVQ